MEGLTYHEFEKVTDKIKIVSKAGQFHFNVGILSMLKKHTLPRAGMLWEILKAILVKKFVTH